MHLLSEYRVAKRMLRWLVANPEKRDFSLMKRFIS